MELLIQRAKSFHGSVVLPEGQDPRVMQAAAEIARRGFARVTVLASPAEAQQACAAAGVIPTGFDVVDPAQAPLLGELAAAYQRKRAAKGVTPEQAREALQKRLYVGAMMVETGRAPGVIVEERGLRQVTDTGAIEAVIDDVLAKNADKVAEFRSGKDKLFGFFVGQTMKAMQGKGNPALVNEVLKKKLS